MYENLHFLDLKIKVFAQLKIFFVRGWEKFYFDRHWMWYLLYIFFYNVIKFMKNL